jgi:hypothetical protein
LGAQLLVQYFLGGDIESAENSAAFLATGHAELWFILPTQQEHNL